VTADFRLELWYLFPDNSHQTSDASLTDRAFKSTLADIQSVGLRIQATTEVTDHLQLEGNVVKILKMTPALCEALWMYDQNRVARYVVLINLLLVLDAQPVHRALRLDTLGAEIFSSLNVLYGKDEGYTEAAALKLIEPPAPQFLQRLRLAFLIGSTPVVSILHGRATLSSDVIHTRYSPADHTPWRISYGTAASGTHPWSFAVLSFRGTLLSSFGSLSRAS
jgi:hypothetical protein